MSVPVDLSRLEAMVRGLGPESLLATVTENGRPHIVSVVVEWSDGTIGCGGGRRTRINAATNPTVTLIWPTIHDDAYRLIVDGPAAVDDAAERITVTPTFAVLHRISTAPDTGPNCIPIES